MPGLTGLVSLRDPKEKISKTVEKMTALMSHEDYYTVDKKACESFGIGAVDTGLGGSVSNVAEDGSYIFAFTGYVYDLEGLNGKVFPDGKETIETTGLLFNLFKKSGIEALCGLNGVYAAVIWDKKEKSLSIVNDRYGFRKLFYWDSGDRFVFSSEYKAIKSSPDFPAKIDEMTLSNILTFGYALEDRTLFEAVKVIPAASVVTVKDGGVSIKKYWDYSFFEEGDKRLSEDEYVDAFAEKITGAVKKRVRGVERLALPLSGGLDSRTVAAVLGRLNTVGFVKAYSHGNPSCYDVRFGRQIARALNFPHATDLIGEEFIKEHSVRFQYLCEGSAACDWAWEIDLQRKAFSKDNVSHVISGFFGDVLCGSDMTWGRLLNVKDHNKAVRNIYERYIDSFSDEDAALYLNADVYKRIKGKNLDAVRKAYLSAPTENIFNRARYLNLTQLQRRFGSTMLDRYEFFTNPLAPFTDNEFVDFILHVPVEHELRQSLYKKMLVRHFPEVARIGYSGTGIPVDPSRWQEGLKWRLEKWGPVLKKLSRGLYGRRDNNDYRNAAKALRTKSREFMLEAFKDSTLKEAYFNSERFDSLVEEFLKSGSNQYEKVCYPLTFFVWARVFLSDGLTGSFVKTVQTARQGCRA